ncbi:MAG: ABC transporter permease, partial [Nitrospinota bacterium]
MTTIGEIQERLRESSLRSLVGLSGPVVAIVLALVVEALLLLAIGKNPWVAYTYLFEGSVGTVFGITETLVKATPLLLAGLGVAFAFKAGLFNIGAEGQILVGSLAAAAVSLKVQGLPPALLIPLAAVAAIAAGGIWGGIPGWLRARLRANEIIVTIMLNYVALNLVRYMVNVPLREKSGFYPKTDTFPRATWLPNLVADTRLHVGLLVALAAAVLVYYLIAHTTVGYRLRTVGANREAAEYGG